MMINEEEIYQYESLCSKLLHGFISWIEANDEQEIALILDSAYDFKYQILNLEQSSLQQKYFIEAQGLSHNEIILLINQWKETFSKLINSKADRVSKDSFKVWFLTVAAYGIPSLAQKGNLLWSKLIQRIEFCEKFSLNDIPYPYNKITKN
jgi:hypothetical protein|tara:strand:- start:2804 stop:3256 length:453 start_codon:yes stop_codon:yes gene_type:complete